MCVYSREKVVYNFHKKVKLLVLFYESQTCHLFGKQVAPVLFYAVAKMNFTEDEFKM